MSSKREYVYIAHGFAEGAWHSRQLRHDLERNGYSVVDNPRDATVVIAHSGGCYMVPADKQYATVLLVDVTYWPERPFLRRVITKIRRDSAHTRKQYGYIQWVRKSLLGAGYAIIQPNRAYAMLAAMRGNQLPLVHAKRIIVVRNQYDPWLSQTFHQAFAHPEATFVSLPGEHDDLWEHPTRYADLLRVRNNIQP